MSTPLTDESAPSWAVRLEAKMDVLLSKHDARITVMESGFADHEHRMRVVEAGDYVTTKGLMFAMTSAVGIATGLITFIQKVS